MKKSLIFILVIVAIIIIGFIFINISREKDYRGEENQQSSTFQQNLQDSEQTENENCDIMFTEYLIEAKYVQKLGQIGVVHGGGKSIVERSYISIKEEYKEQEIPVYAPTDMDLVAGAHYTNPSANQDTLADYVLKFDAGCDVEVLLGHLKGVVDSISSQLTPLKTTSAEDEIRPSIHFKAGEKIGYYIQENKPGAVGGFDFVVRDRKIINKFINQERYSEDRARNLISGVCPYDYYTPDKKQIYYNLLGGAGGKIFDIKDCGTASRDKAGTISGMWFLDKEIVGTIYDDRKEGEYGSPISLMADEEATSIGNIGPIAINRIYSNNPTYKPPTEVTTEHCYQIKSSSDNNGFIYFKLIDDTTLDVYYSQSGDCPATFPASNARRYYK